jgi:hypothetical protein
VGGDAVLAVGDELDVGDLSDVDAVEVDFSAGGDAVGVEGDEGEGVRFFVAEGGEHAEDEDSPHEADEGDEDGGTDDGVSGAFGEHAVEFQDADPRGIVSLVKSENAKGQAGAACSEGRRRTAADHSQVGRTGRLADENACSRDGGTLLLGCFAVEARWRLVTYMGWPGRSTGRGCRRTGECGR